MTNRICDIIIAFPALAPLALRIARMIDPTESHIAAEIRDAIRDNDLPFSANDDMI